MSQSLAMLWFLLTIALFTTLMVVGIYEAAHSYDTRSHHHWWQRHR